MTQWLKICFDELQHLGGKEFQEYKDDMKLEMKPEDAKQLTPAGPDAPPCPDMFAIIEYVLQIWNTDNLKFCSISQLPKTKYFLSRIYTMMLCYIILWRCEDAQKWIQGFKEHANNRVGSWGFEVPITRSEFCDEHYTKVFRSAAKQNVVCIDLKSVKMPVLGPLLNNPEFNKLETALGEKKKHMYIVNEMPSPPK